MDFTEGEELRRALTAKKTDKSARGQKKGSRGALDRDAGNTADAANKPFKSVLPNPKRSRTDADAMSESDDVAIAAKIPAPKRNPTQNLISPPPGHSAWSDDYATRNHGERKIQIHFAHIMLTMVRCRFLIIANKLSN